jgi:hypothetical protein
MSAPDAVIYPRTRQLWPVVTAETMVRGLYGSGLTFSQLMCALQGQAPYTLQSMIASLDPDFSIDSPMPDETTLSVLNMIVDPTVAAITPDVLMRVDTPRGEAAIVIRSTSVLDRARLRTCYSRSCDEPIDPRRCTTRNAHGPVRHDRPYFPVVDVEVPAAASPTTSQPSGPPYCIRFFVPVRMSGNGEPRWLRVPGLWPLQARIRQVTGVAFEGTLPGPEVRLIDDRATTGIIEVEASAHRIGPESDWLEQPPLLEVGPANEMLLEPYRRGRVTLR